MARSPDKPALPADLSDEALDPLQEEALHWLAFLHSGKETEDDWATYQNWRAMDLAHRAAAEEAERLWERLGLALRPPSRPKTGGMPVILAGMLVTAGIAFAAGLFGEPRAYIADQRTGIGERRTVTLVGGTVEMDSNTSFDVGPDGRSVTLYTGQIFVAVTSQPGQSFLVKADNGSVRTLGTKFVVRRTGAGAKTFVTEHAVRVAYPLDTPGATVDVASGQQVDFGAGLGLGAPRAADLTALTAWQRGELVFNQTPLSAVAEDLERYRRGKVVVIGDDARKLSVTGNFHVDDTDSVLDSIELALRVHVLRLPGLVIIRAGSSADASPTRRAP